LLRLVFNCDEPNKAANNANTHMSASTNGTPWKTQTGLKQKKLLLSKSQ